MTTERTVPAPDRVARNARRAVLALFVINGSAFAGIVPWLPTIKAELELSNAALGSAIAAMPLGSLLTGMLAGPLIARFGSGRTAMASGVILALLLPAIALAPTWILLAAPLFLFGALDGWMDASMNAHGLRVQRRYGRSIINTFHAAWSIGAVSGGLVGATMAGAGVPMLVHTSLVAAVLITLGAVAARHLLAGPEHTERAAEVPTPATANGRRWRAVPWRSVGLLAVLGVLLMMAGAVEDAAASWGAVFLRVELGTSAFLAGLPFVACQALMTTGRLVGDRLTDRFGAVAVARTGSLLAAAGLGGALLVPTPATAILGFGLCGLGVATLFPLALAAAGDIPGIRSGDGVTVVAWLARVGFLAFPPVVGLLADATRLGVALALIPLAALVAAALAGTLRGTRT